MAEITFEPAPEDASASCDTMQVSAGLAESLYSALRRNDAAACRRLAEQAGGLRDARAVEPLCDLLTLPARSGSGHRLRRRTWVWARIAAVNALAQIHAVNAVPALTEALFDPDPLVREAAAYVLPCFGNHAVPPLIRALRTRVDWPVHSMKLLISTLGGLGSRRATPVLLHILAEHLPADPTRWARQTFLRPFTILLTAFACWWIGALILYPPDLLPGLPGYLQALLDLLLNSIVPFLFFYMVLVCVFFVPIHNFSSARERDELTEAAIQALTQLNDKRAIPAITEIAFGPRTQLRQSARAALQSLLPLLQAEDAARFPGQAQLQLARALGTCEPDLEMEIVKALAHVGTGQAVGPVSYLAAHGETPLIRQEAQRVLPLLQARARQEKAAASLLRASKPPSIAAEELLRIPDPEPPASSEELLRPQ